MQNSHPRLPRGYQRQRAQLEPSGHRLLACGLTFAINLNEHVCKKTSSGSRTLNFTISIETFPNSSRLEPIQFLCNYYAKSSELNHPAGLLCATQRRLKCLWGTEKKPGVAHESGRATGQAAPPVPGVPELRPLSTRKPHTTRIH